MGGFFGIYPEQQKEDDEVHRYQLATLYDQCK